MIIYTLNYSDSDADFCKIIEAFPNKKLAEKRYAEVEKEGESDGNITLIEKELAITKHIITTKKQLIATINTL